MDPDRLGKLMDLAERWQQDQARIAYSAAMAACQAEMPAIIRDKENDFTHKMYARFETLNSQIRPIYTRHGFSLNWTTEPIEKPGFVRMICDVRHKAGHFARHQGDFPIDDGGMKGGNNKSPIQAVGSTYSYARRYLAKLIFSLAEADEDNDGNSFPDTLIADEVSEMEDLITDSGANRELFLQWVARIHGTDAIDIQSILRKHFGRIMDELKRKKAKVNK